MKKREDTDWRLVDEFNVNVYKCGLLVGDVVELLDDLKITQDGRVVEVIKSGEKWVTLKGTVDSPNVVWFRRPCGKIHTWDDGEKLFDYFELVRPE